MITKTRFIWKNTIKKYKVQPLRYFEPENLKDIQSVVREAEDIGVRVRAVGSGHSFSDVAVTNGYLINLKHLNRPLALEKKQLTTKWKEKYPQLVHVEAGMTIEAFNKAMEQRGLCVVNMGAIDEQTLAGAIATGTHGTGVELPAMSGMVRSMVVVGHNGDAYRIEPADGITDPKEFDEPGVDLIQDDQIFNSLLVSLGCMGIIYSYILELEPMYWLEESKELSTWSRVSALLKEKKRAFLTKDAAGNPIRGLSILVNPYSNEKGDHTCLVVRHKLVSPPKKRSLNARLRNLTGSLLAEVQPISLITYHIAKLIGRRFPKRVPGLLERSIRSLKDKTYINKGYKVLYQGVEYIKLRAYDSEYAFDIDAKGPNYIDAINQIFEKAAEMAKEHNLYQTSPIGLRFVKRSTAYLTPEYGREVCYIDTAFLLDTKGADEMLDHYQDIFLRNDGIPHWGKINNRLQGRPDLLIKYYPKLEEWQSVFRFFNYADTFCNNFSDRLGLGSIDSTYLKKRRKTDKVIGQK